MTTRILSIRQLARETGVSSKTLRYWETRGLLPRSRRTHTGYRQYTETDLERVIFIRKAKSLGFTLAEVRQVFDLARSGKAPCEAVLRWADAKVHALERQIRGLQEMKGQLQRVQRRWSVERPPRRLDADEICRCIASVPVPTSRETHAVSSGKGGRNDGREDDRQPVPRLRRLPDR